MTPTATVEFVTQLLDCARPTAHIHPLIITPTAANAMSMRSVTQPSAMVTEFATIPVLSSKALVPMQMDAGVQETKTVLQATVF